MGNKQSIADNHDRELEEKHNDASDEKNNDGGDAKFVEFVGLDYLYDNIHDSDFIDEAESDTKELQSQENDRKTRNHIYENLAILRNRASYQFQMKQSLVHKPMNQQMMNPNCVVFGYKVVRLCSINPDDMTEGTDLNVTSIFPSKLKIVNDACAILRLVIDMYSSKISYGSHYELQNASKLDRRTKYCTNKCIVTGAQVLATADRISPLFEKIKSGEVRFVSNMCMQFEYKLEHEVNEANFGKTGTGCIQGIHFFLSPNKALSYSGNGFLADLDLKQVPMLLSNEIVEYADQPEKLDKSKLLASYMQNIDYNDEKMKELIEDLLGPSYVKHNYGVKELCFNNSTLASLANIRSSASKESSAPEKSALDADL
jgi:hypothetical protein